MVKTGQIYREKITPFFRRDDGDFVVTYNLFTNCDILYSNGKTAHVSIDWIRRDCELIKEFNSWQEAIKEFRQ